MKELVRAGYDKISYAYRGDKDEAGQYLSWLAELTPLLVPRSKVLDLGCGCGVPVAQELSKDFYVTGVDISPVQIERAKQLVPKAQFLCENGFSVLWSRFIPEGNSGHTLVLARKECQ